MNLIFIKFLNSTRNRERRTPRSIRFVKSLFKSIESIANDIKHMKREFDNQFTDLIFATKQFNLNIMRLKKQKPPKDYHRTGIYDPSLIAKLLHDVFFDHLISFYDKFSSRINYKINRLYIFNERKQHYLIRDISGLSKEFHFRQEFDIKTVESTEYPGFEYFVLRLENLVSNQLNLDINYIRHVLYMGYTHNDYYNIMGLWRRWCGVKFQLPYSKNVGTTHAIDVNLSENIKRLSYFNAKTRLNIMKEFRLSSRTVEDLRFVFLREMIQKHGSFDKIPNNSCFYRCNCPETQTDRKCIGEIIHQEYFKYISYSFSEQGYSYIYSKAMAERVTVFKHYNMTRQRVKDHKYITQKK
ncbi:hypothetical protein CDIK_0804 [Cucumispora dikerogammari]|nr:hypothetical protein CDIK_0804 [Cucumispora dikerogammari]